MTVGGERWSVNRSPFTVHRAPSTVHRPPCTVSPTTVHGSPSTPMSIAALRLVLLIRAAISVGFALSVASRPPTAHDLLAAFAVYAFVDATLLVFQVVVMLGLRAPSEYVAAAGFALLLRLGAALAIWLGPGIPYFAVALVLYTGLLATLVLLAGIIELVEVRRAHKGPAVLRAILTVEGVATIGLALLAIVLTPVPATVRALLILGALLEARSLLLVAVVGLASARKDALLQGGNLAARGNTKV